MGGGREKPVAAYIGSEPYEENAVPLLGDAIVSRVCLMKVDTIAKPVRGLPNLLLVPLQASEIHVPICVLGNRKFRKLELQSDELNIIGKCWTQ